jgi:hypothetical protein
LTFQKNNDKIPLHKGEKIMAKGKGGSKGASGGRNDDRTNGKAFKKNAGRQGHGSHSSPLDQGFLLMLGKGPLTRKGSVFYGDPDSAKKMRLKAAKAKESKNSHA